MKRWLCLSIGLLLASLLGGCMTTDQGLSMQRGQLEMERRMTDAERSIKAFEEDQSGGVRARLETLARNQADFQASLDSMRVDVQGMQGQYADLERIREDLRQDLTLLKDELSLQVADLEQRIAQLEKAPVPATAPAPPAASKPAPVTTSAVVAPVVSTPAVTPAAESASGLYDRALRMIRDQQDFAGGRELMQTFLKRYPNDPLAVNAAYWVGETYYAEKSYDKAVLQFEEVIQGYGDHPKVASALLKQGLAFDAMGDRANGKLLLQQVVGRFPLSEEAKKSKETLKEWGG
jgi:tol-pal system protein YbgF